MNLVPKSLSDFWVLKKIGGIQMEGTVKFFNKLKGFGFIKGDDERDYFVHVSFIGGGKYLQENDRVSFEGVEDEKGLKAKDVEIIGKAEPVEGAPVEEQQTEEQPVEEPQQEESTEEAPVEEEEKKEESVEETPAEEQSAEEEKKEE